MYKNVDLKTVYKAGDFFYLNEKKWIIDEVNDYGIDLLLSDIPSPKHGDIINFNGKNYIVDIVSERREKQPNSQRDVFLLHQDTKEYIHTTIGEIQKQNAPTQGVHQEQTQYDENEELKNELRLYISIKVESFENNQIKKTRKTIILNILYSVIILCILASLILFIHNLNKKKRHIQKQETVSSSFTNLDSTIHTAQNYKTPVFWYKYNRMIGLLSLKYNVKDSLIENIMMEYMKINYPIDYISLGGKDSIDNNDLFEPKETIKETVLKINKNYRIEINIIGSILFDMENSILLIKENKD